MSDTNVVTYIIPDDKTLCAMHMPFVSDVGLFIPTKLEFSLGAEVTTNLQFPNEDEFLQLNGKIVWVNFKNSLNMNEQGVGVKFSGEAMQKIRDRLKKTEKKLETGVNTM